MRPFDMPTAKLATLLPKKPTVTLSDLTVGDIVYWNGGGENHYVVTAIGEQFVLIALFQADDEYPDGATDQEFAASPSTLSFLI